MNKMRLKKKIFLIMESKSKNNKIIFKLKNIKRYTLRILCGQTLKKIAEYFRDDVFKIL